MFRRMFEKPIGIAHPIHPDDEAIVDQCDRKWFAGLRRSDPERLSKEDDLFRVAAFLKYKDDGMSATAAARETWKFFPYYYIDVTKRSQNPHGFVGEDAELPFAIKDRVNRLLTSGRIRREELAVFSTMNAMIRSVIRR